MKISIRSAALFAGLALLLSPAHAQLSWEQMNGPYGGHVNAVTSEPDGTIWVTMHQNGIYRKRPGESAWALVSSSSFSEPYVVTIDSGGVKYAGSFNHLHRMRADGDWEQVEPIFAQFIEAGPTGEIIVGGSLSELHRFDPGSDTWTDIWTGITSRLQRIAVDRQGTCWAATFHTGLFRRATGDAEFTRVTRIPEESVTDLHHDGADAIYASTASTVYRGSIVDGTWTPLDSGAFGRSIVGRIAVSAAGDLYAGTWDGRLFAMPAGEAGWREITGPMRVRSITDLHVDRSGTLWIGTAGGLFRLPSGETIPSPIDLNIAAHRVGTLLFDTEGNLFCGTETAGIFVRRRGESDWRQLNNGLKGFGIYAMALDSNGDVLAMSDSTFQRLPHGDTIWRPYETIEYSFSRYPSSVCVASPGEIVIAGLWHLRDGVWRKDSLTPNRDGPGFFDRLISFARAPDGILFAGTTAGSFYELLPGDSIWRRTTRLVHLERTGFYPAIESFAFARDGSIYIGTNMGNFIFPKGGFEWAWLEEGIDHGDARGVLSEIVAGPRSDLFSVLIDVLQWKRSEERWVRHDIRWLIPRTFISPLLITIDDADRLYVGTAAHSVLVSSPVTASVAEEDGRRSEEHLRLACSPNPASDQVTLRFTVIEPGHVTLRVIDALGNVAATPVDGSMEPGEHTSDLSLSGLASGVYLIVLESGSSRSIEQMVLAP